MMSEWMLDNRYTAKYYKYLAILIRSLSKKERFNNCVKASLKLIQTHADSLIIELT